MTVEQDRQALEEWAVRRLKDDKQSSSPEKFKRVTRFIAAVSSLPLNRRIRFLTIALLYEGDLSEIFDGDQQ